jgi:hypothetical protein
MKSTHFMCLLCGTHAAQLPYPQGLDFACMQHHAVEAHGGNCSSSLPMTGAQAGNKKGVLPEGGRPPPQVQHAHELVLHQLRCHYSAGGRQVKGKPDAPAVTVPVGEQTTLADALAAQASAASSALASCRSAVSKPSVNQS